MHKYPQLWILFFDYKWKISHVVYVYIYLYYDLTVTKSNRSLNFILHRLRPKHMSMSSLVLGVVCGMHCQGRRRLRDRLQPSRLNVSFWMISNLLSCYIWSIFFVFSFFPLILPLFMSCNLICTGIALTLVISKSLLLYPPNPPLCFPIRYLT